MHPSRQFRLLSPMNIINEQGTCMIDTCNCPQMCVKRAVKFASVGFAWLRITLRQCCQTLQDCVVVV